MDDKLNDVIEHALSLPPVQRARLIEALYKSFQSPGERSIEQAWVEESERRIDSHERGDIASVPYEDMKRDLPHRDR